jgi:hypothetical protein
VCIIYVCGNPTHPGVCFSVSRLIQVCVLFTKKKSRTRLTPAQQVSRHFLTKTRILRGRRKKSGMKLRRKSIMFMFVRACVRVGANRKNERTSPTAICMYVCMYVCTYILRPN